MQRQNVIILIKNNLVEAWGNLREACGVHGWSYSTVSKQKLPIEKDGWRVNRVPFKEKSDDKEVEQKVD